MSKREPDYAFLYSIMDKMRSFSDLERIGHQLKLARIRADLKQATAATKAGISRAHLSRIEHGQVDVSIRVLMYIATAVGITMQELFRRVEEMPRKLG